MQARIVFYVWKHRSTRVDEWRAWHTSPVAAPHTSSTLGREEIPDRRSSGKTEKWLVTMVASVAWQFTLGRGICLRGQACSCIFGCMVSHCFRPSDLIRRTGCILIGHVSLSGADQSGFNKKGGNLQNTN